MQPHLSCHLFFRTLRFLFLLVFLRPGLFCCQPVLLLDHSLASTICTAPIQMAEELATIIRHITVTEHKMADRFVHIPSHTHPIIVSALPFFPLLISRKLTSSLLLLACQHAQIFCAFRGDEIGRTRPRFTHRRGRRTFTNGTVA